MMLLAEQYLHGRVGFTSTPEHGTFFTVTLPFSQGGAEHGLSAPAAAL
jgi:signal transduction histidine kinase